MKLTNESNNELSTIKMQKKVVSGTRLVWWESFKLYIGFTPTEYSHFELCCRYWMTLISFRLLPFTHTFSSPERNREKQTGKEWSTSMGCSKAVYAFRRPSVGTAGKNSCTQDATKQEGMVTSLLWPLYYELWKTNLILTCHKNSWKSRAIRKANRSEATTRGVDKQVGNQ